MPLSTDQLAAIRAWTQDDLYLAIRTYQRANPDPSSPVARAFSLSAVEFRVLDILSQRLPAQLAATTLIPAAQQDMADRLSAFYGPKGANVDEWTAAVPPSIAALNYFVGDILESLEDDRLPALVVTASLPGGADEQAGAIGTLSEQTLSLAVYYVQKYSPSREVQSQALCGAEAVANILRTCRQDAVTLWKDGKVTHAGRNVSLSEKGPRFISGLVRFSCTAFLPYTANRQ